MGKPIVAIVGRPNVGKSTLFNKLVGQRLAIVEDTPGVTRDRLYGNCEWQDHRFLLIDTGGIEPKADDVLLRHMRGQAQLAIDEATRQGTSLYLFGEAEHPEVQGLVSYANGPCLVFGSLKELKEKQTFKDTHTMWCWRLKPRRNARNSKPSKKRSRKGIPYPCSKPSATRRAGVSRKR